MVTSDDVVEDNGSSYGWLLVMTWWRIMAPVTDTFRESTDDEVVDADGLIFTN